jgi:O-methyltransferase
VTLRHEMRRLLNRGGWDVHRHREHPPDLTPAQIELWELVRPYTMLDVERVVSLADAVEYVVGSAVPGAVVECGVGLGGAMMAAARTLARLGVSDRDVYLLDTFAGMSEPTELDLEVIGRSMIGRMRAAYRNPEHQLHVTPTLETVRANMARAGYPQARTHYVVGRVEDTLPEQAPEQISILRIDTDWYESTRHELEHLYPRLADGGVLIVDDYGHWAHQRSAVDAYFEGRRRPLLVRVGYACRVAVK